MSGDSHNVIVNQLFYYHFLYSLLQEITYSESIQVVGWKGAGESGNGSLKLGNDFEGFQEEYDWNDVEADLYHWTKTLRPVQVCTRCELDIALLNRFNFFIWFQMFYLLILMLL